MTRYARQIQLPQVGTEGQTRLTAAHALVVGAGGLGVPVLLYLAGAGVGRITLVDGDRIEESNLHRQPIYRMDQLGHPKAEAAAATLRAMNPAVTVTPRSAWLDPALAAELVPQADVVLDCADTFAASLTLSDACMAAGKPLVTASALGLSGYVAGCCGGAPSLRALFPDLPERGATCATAGVLGPVVGAVGAMQTQAALAVLLGLAPSPLGRVTSFDALTLRTASFRFDAAPEPETALPFIAADQIGAADLIVDLRTEEPRPFRPDALHLSAADLLSRPLPDAPRVVLACRTGLRAHNAGMALRARWGGDVVLHAVTG